MCVWYANLSYSLVVRFCMGYIKPLLHYIEVCMGYKRFSCIYRNTTLHMSIYHFIVCLPVIICITESTAAEIYSSWWESCDKYSASCFICHETVWSHCIVTSYICHQTLTKSSIFHTNRSSSGLSVYCILYSLSVVNKMYFFDPIQ